LNRESRPQTELNSARGVLALLELPGVGTGSALRIAARFSSYEEIRTAPLDRLKGLSRAAPALSSRDEWQRAQDLAEQTLTKLSSLGIRAVSFSDPEYPALFQGIPDQPPMLYVKGQLREGIRNVACVGTRHPSRFGEEVSSRITRVIAEKGWSIVSGLALGVDSLCHQAALDVNGHTVAILANSLETVYPRRCVELADRILDGGGALVSEQPLGTPPIPRNFVHRDRLQSGMSVATIVMQTDFDGGAMHTVRFALTQGRRVLVPRPTDQHAAEPKSRGLMAMLTSSGPEFARLVGAVGPYAELLRHVEGHVASAIEGRDHYDSVLGELETLAQARKIESI
jgi:DNA processing protein